MASGPNLVPMKDKEEKRKIHRGPTPEETKCGREGGPTRGNTEKQRVARETRLPVLVLQLPFFASGRAGTRTGPALPPLLSIRTCGALFFSRLEKKNQLSISEAEAVADSGLLTSNALVLSLSLASRLVGGLNSRVFTPLFLVLHPPHYGTSCRVCRMEPRRRALGSFSFALRLQCA